jgi:hypothetical protein
LAARSWVIVWIVASSIGHFAVGVATASVSRGAGGVGRSRWAASLSRWKRLARSSASDGRLVEVFGAIDEDDGGGCQQQRADDQQHDEELGHYAHDRLLGRGVRQWCKSSPVEFMFEISRRKPAAPFRPAQFRRLRRE